MKKNVYKVILERVLDSEKYVFVFASGVKVVASEFPDAIDIILIADDVQEIYG